MLLLEEFLKTDRKKKVYPYKVDYFTQYKHIKDSLADGLYKELPACATFIDRCFYTNHGLEHVEDVIEFAGYILGVESKSDFSKLRNKISAYEVYLLLTSILLHDAGMVGGRDGHEKKAKKILLEMGQLAGADSIEKANIAEIAKAHSGKKDGNDVDTMNEMQLGECDTIVTSQFRPKMIAAIVRLADEICETKRRAARYCIGTGGIPKENEAYHYYANSINSVKVDHESKTIHIEYIVSVEFVNNLIGMGNDEVYIIDVIKNRLEKMNRERIYCNRFMAGSARFDILCATIKIVNDEYTMLGAHEYLATDIGYPSDVNTFGDKYPDFNNDYFITKYKTR